MNKGKRYIKCIRCGKEVRGKQRTKCRHCAGQKLREIAQSIK